MDRIRRILAAGVCLGFAGGAPCSGEVILASNPGEPTRAITDFSSEVPGAPGHWAAQAFVTGASSYRLSSLDTLLGNLVGSPTVLAELPAQGAPPGARPLLTTFNVPALGSTQGLVGLTPTSLVTLAPNSTYWIVFGVMGPGTLGWSYAQEQPGGAGAQGAYGYSVDNGATWGTFSTDNPYQIRATVEPATTMVAPDPASWVLLLLGLAGLAGWRQLSRQA